MGDPDLMSGVAQPIPLANQVLERLQLHLLLFLLDHIKESDAPGKSFVDYSQLDDAMRN